MMQDATPPVILFRDDDPGFLMWIRANPAGFILNRYRATNTKNYLVLHRARCRLFHASRSSPYALTGARYVKVCALTADPLAAHATQAGGSTRRCRVCNP